MFKESWEKYKILWIIMIIFIILTIVVFVFWIIPEESDRTACEGIYPKPCAEIDDQFRPNCSTVINLTKEQLNSPELTANIGKEHVYNYDIDGVCLPEYGYQHYNVPVGEWSLNKYCWTQPTGTPSRGWGFISKACNAPGYVNTSP